MSTIPNLNIKVSIIMSDGTLRDGEHMIQWGATGIRELLTRVFNIDVDTDDLQLKRWFASNMIKINGNMMSINLYQFQAIIVRQPKATPAPNWDNLTKVDGTQYLYVDVASKAWAQYYFSDETSDVHGPWLTKEEALAQFMHYCKYTLG